MLWTLLIGLLEYTRQDPRGDPFWRSFSNTYHWPCHGSGIRLLPLSPEPWVKRRSDHVGFVVYKVVLGHTLILVYFRFFLSVIFHHQCSVLSYTSPTIYDIKPRFLRTTHPWVLDTWWVIPWSRKTNWCVLCGFGVLKITLAIFVESRVRNTYQCLAPLVLQTSFLAIQTWWYKEVDFQKLNINPLIIFWLKFNWFSENPSCHLPDGSWKWMW